MSFYKISSAFLLCLSLLGCASSSPEQARAEQKVAINTMQYEVLQNLYTKEPNVKAQIKDVAGYAVFDNANVNLVFASFGSGYGVVTNNQTMRRTYMKMAEAGVGFGAGLKDFSLVMLFHSDEALQRFIEHGWTIGAQADAAAKAGDNGVAAGGEASIGDVTVYQLTESGIALQATIKGTKFWQDEALN